MIGWVRRLSIWIVALIVFAPTTAFGLSEAVLISQLQTGGSGSGTASQEYLALVNSSVEPIDITNWCVYYSSSSDTTKTKLGCFVPPNAATNLMLDSDGFARLSSSEFAALQTGFVPDLVFAAGISGTSGHIRVYDAQNTEIDRIGWGLAANPETTAIAAHASGKILERKQLNGEYVDTDNNGADFAETTLTILPASGIVEREIIDVCGNIPGNQDEAPSGYVIDADGVCYFDTCTNLDGLQKTMPDGYHQTDVAICELTPLESSTILISELLPNALSYDTGNEYIELYNPNNRSVNVGGYVLQTGSGYSKQYTLPEIIFEPLSYMTFSDIVSGLVLPNSSASVRLVAHAGNIVSETPAYDTPPENYAWALIDDIWQYTNQPTPAAANLASLLEVDALGAGEVAGLAPCSAGKVRNPETNRCRNIAVDTELKPCNADQVRNPETNRCRAIESSELQPCKEGQIRNPETNRCRSAVLAASELKPCAEGEERNPETNRCRKVSLASAASKDAVKDVQSVSSTPSAKWGIIGFLVLGAGGYALFEWRHEVAAALRAIAARFGISK